MLRVLILVAVVVGVALWLLKGRRTDRTPPEPATMVACAHCGVHLPRPEATYDADGRSYCGEPHRLAGPR